MKRFEVPVKSTLFDFTRTKDIWLTIHPTLKNLSTDKRDCNDTLLFSLGKPLPLKKDTSSSSLNRYFQKNSHLNENLFLYQANKFQLDICQNHHYSSYYYNGKDKIEPIEASCDSLHVSPGARFFITNHPLSPNLQYSLLTHLKKLSDFSFPLFFTINEIIQNQNPKSRLLCLFDFSQNESYEFEIKSNLKSVSFTIEMIKNKILKYDYKKIWKIETVLHEALVNAITYGNELNPKFTVRVHYEIGPNGFRIWVRDKGEGFDIDNISVPVGRDALDRISGRGIYIMKKFSDTLFFNRKGNEVMAFFEFKKDEEE